MLFAPSAFANDKSGKKANADAKAKQQRTVQPPRNVAVLSTQASVRVTRGAKIRIVDGVAKLKARVRFNTIRRPSGEVLFEFQ